MGTSVVVLSVAVIDVCHHFLRVQIMLILVIVAEWSL